ncbi:putative DNA repair protein Rad18 [Aulographum hederae CBS 113979]|uniref:Putative DNA repair protein Rad18 n=1 Tax=Aulographum hederae CBS 113979 TaxID=1176131 RepID=A0A6G1GT31_9PEZI|nr:putative DNA repair protein Rad18 [Aulographum hederae CBS 113979]
MAPTSSRKRPRPDVDDSSSGGEEVEVVTASANLRRDSGQEPAHRKKRRSSAGPASSNDDSDYDSEEEARQDKEDEMRAAQLVAAKFRSERPNLPAENGIVKEVTMRNFMCHANLSMKLGPLINFIIGHNGSGKSAVLTALTLCLGGKATSTNRGQSLKSFIKEGAEQCSLRVHIKNEGFNAFKHDVFGDTIIVERHFSRSGTSGFKIRNAADKIISTKRADLDDINDAFGLQMDNPMTVLTQDQARSFLNHSTAIDKYKLFYCGTQLSQLDKDYQLTAETLDQAHGKLDLSSGDVQEARRILQAAEAKVRQANQQRTLDAKIKEYENQIAWVQVQGQEDALEALRNQVAEHDSEMEQQNAVIEDATEKFDQAHLAASGASTDLETLQTELQPRLDEESELKEKCKEKIQKRQESKKEERKMDTSIKGVQAGIAEYENKIAIEEQKLRDANGGENAQLVADLHEAEKDLQEANAALEEHQRGKSPLEEQSKKARDAAEATKQPLHTKIEEARAAENVITQLQNSAGTPFSAYGLQMGRLLDAIKRDRGFKTTPVGPIGYHVRLLKPEWCSILNKSFGGILNNFIVTNRDDQRRLQGLMRTHNCQQTILIGNSQPLDTSRGEPEPGVLTWLRALRIDEPLVRNQLIINSGIEQTVLIEKRENAHNYMYGGRRPSNVKQCFCMATGDKSRGHRFGFASGGDQTISPIQAWKDKSRMQLDKEDEIKLAQNNLDNANRAFRDAEARDQEAEAHAQECFQALEQHKRDFRRLNVQQQQAERNRNRCKDKLEQATPQTGELEIYREHLQKGRDELDNLENQMACNNDAQDALIEEEAGVKEELKKLGLEIKEAQTKITKAEAKKKALDAQRQDALLEKNGAIERQNHFKEQRSKLEAEIKDQEAQVETYTSQATEVCGLRIAVPPGATFQGLLKKHERAQKDKAQYEQQAGGSIEELNQAVLEAKVDLKAKRFTRECLQQTHKTLRQSLDMRQVRFEKFKRFISARARQYFTYLLSERKFRGTLQINHKHKVMDIHVEPDITKASSDGRQTKTLSGGEKSFSTICLLLSLWEAMGSPMRCLDEFDVFMDNVNRDISMRMMISAARRSVSRQFVLISPQSLGAAISAGQDDVRIIKMTDPERGQTTLEFGAA